MTCANQSQFSCKDGRTCKLEGKGTHQKTKRAVLQFYPLPKFQNTRTSFFQAENESSGEPCTSWQEASIQKKCFCTPNHPKCDVLLGWSIGVRKVPATFAPRSAMALIRGSRLVSLLLLLQIKTLLCTPGGSGTLVSWWEAKSHGDHDDVAHNLEQRSSAAFLQSFTASFAASPNYFEANITSESRHWRAHMTRGSTSQNQRFFKLGDTAELQPRGSTSHCEGLHKWKYIKRKRTVLNSNDGR